MRILTLFFLIYSGSLYAQQGVYGATGFLWSAVRSPYDLVVQVTGKLQYNKVKSSQHPVLNNACTIWSNESNECSCEQVCPMSLKLLDKNVHQYYPSEGNSLSERNHDFDYPLGDQWGHCWGHALFTQKLTRLAFFDPSQKLSFPEGGTKWCGYYKQIIRDISQNKARVVPGFENIKSFSAHPALKKFFRRQVSKLWFLKSASLAGMIQTGSGHVNEKGYLKYVKAVSDRIAKNQIPVVVSNIPIPIVGSFAESHVFVAWKIEKDRDGNTVICYRDNNLSPKMNASCFARDIISPEGVLLENWWFANKTIAYNEDAETYQQLLSLRGLCKRMMCK